MSDFSQGLIANGVCIAASFAVGSQLHRDRITKAQYYGILTTFQLVVGILFMFILRNYAFAVAFLSLAVFSAFWCLNARTRASSALPQINVDFNERIINNDDPYLLGPNTDLPPDTRVQLVDKAENLFITGWTTHTRGVYRVEWKEL